MLYWITALNFAGTFPRIQSEATLKSVKKTGIKFKDFPLDLDEWPDDHKNAAWALAQTVSVVFRERERAEKMKEIGNK